VKATGPRVVMFLYRDFDLDSRVEREARSLVTAGYEVEVLARQGQALPDREVRDGYAIRRLSLQSRPSDAVLRFSGGGGLGPLRRLASRFYYFLIWRTWTRRAAEAALERPAVLYIGHDLDGLRPGVRAKRSSGCPLVYDAHELYPDMATKERPDYELRGWIAYERRLIRHADLVFAATPSRAEEMRRRFEIELPRVLRNVPEISHAAEADSRVELRTELEIPAEARLLLYLGVLQRTRGLEEAIRALRLLPSDHLVMMGSDYAGYVDDLLELAAEIEVSDRVHLREPVRPHEVVAVARQADVGLVLNHRVGLNNYLSLPNKIFESVAAGVPVVVSDFPDMAELVRQYDVGETCDPTDPADIARAIEALTTDPDRHRELGENAHRAALELSWERESERFLSEVRRLLSD
jgi:glycosyltransferase involved in cell wall biosynthesis